MLFVVGQRQVAEKRDGAREDREREGERERETASYLCRGKCSCMPERSIAGSSFRCSRGAVLDGWRRVGRF